MKVREAVFTVLALIFLLGLILFAYRGCFFGREGFARYDSDYQVEDLPAAEFLKYHILSGNSCLWNPLILCGVPFMAHCEKGFFYPPNTVFQYLLSPDISFRVLCLLHIFLATVGIFGYLRHITGRFTSSIISASVFILCGPTMALMVNCNSDALFTLSWLPLILLTIEKFIVNRGAVFLFFTSISLGLSLLAGELQMYSYVIIFCILYTLFALKRARTGEKITVLKKVSVSLLWGVLMGSVQVIPTIELTLRSMRSRGYAVAVSDALPIRRAIDLIFPELVYFHNGPANNSFVLSFGMLAMFFVIWSIAKERKFAAPFGIMIAFLVLSAFGLPAYRLYYHFFPLAKFVQGGEELIFPLGMMVSVAAGLGWNLFHSNKRIKSGLKQVLFVGLIIECIALNYTYSKGVTQHDDRAHLQEEEEILSIIKQDYRQERVIRFRNEDILLPNVLMSYNIHDAEGFYTFLLKRYAEFIRAIDQRMVSGPGGPGETIEVTDISDDNGLYSPLLNMLNVKYILSSRYIN